jgi:hypothetical protein
MGMVNHFASYIKVVDGNTVWEKLRVIRNFLSDRRTALKLAELSELRLQRRIERFKAENEGDDSSDEYWEIEEALIHSENTKANIQDCVREIQFLEQFEDRLMSAAEPLRVLNKTDEEMYELNYFEELIVSQLLTVSSEIYATGRVSPESMRMLMRNPDTADRAMSMGLLPNEVLEDFKKISIPSAVVTNESALWLTHS